MSVSSPTPSARVSWSGFLAILVAYAGTGLLGIELAIPPGYSSPIWPPAGIALAAALTIGRRALPPILIGATLLVSGTLIARFGFSPRFLAVGAWVALGATLQAAFGAWLVRRLIGYPNDFTRGKDVALLLIAAGPLGSLVSSSWSLPMTIAAGLVPARGALFSWATLYCGDALGTLVFTPVVLVWCAEPRAVWRRRAGSIVLPVLGAFAACTLVYFLISRRDERQIEDSLRQEGASMRHGLEAELLASRSVLHAMQSHAANMDRLDVASFRSFAQDLIEHHAEIHALEWLPRVPGPARASFEQAVRAGGLAGFELRELRDGELAPSAEHEQYFPVLFAEPMVGNESAIGLDLLASPEQREVLERAHRHGELAVSGPIDLAQTSTPGLLLALPVHREKELVGYVVAVMTVEQLLQRATQGSSGRVHLVLHDVTGPDAAPLTEAPSTQHELTWSEEIPFAGRRWQLRFSASRDLLAAQPAWTAWMVLAGGMLLTSVLGGLLLLVTGRTISIETLAQERALELRRKDEERDRIQGQLLHAQKLEVVGRLAGGVAHDVNNFLTVIQGYGEVLRSELETSAPVGRALEEIDKATERAARVVQRLLAFARRQVLHPRPIVPGELVESLRGTLLPLLGERVTLRLDCHSRGTVLADPGQLEQVVMNLAVNARDALLPDGGELHIRVTDVDVEGDASGVPSGRHVRISVIDRGAGMTPEVLERIFEPFYTTKKEGTGLGLSTVYGIVQQSGGAITVESEPGRGTTFHVYLPGVESDVLMPTERRRREHECPPGVVLVVEDEASLRSLLCSFLASRGHEVLTAESAPLAVALAHGRGAPIDLILTDVVMPDMTGPEVVAAVLRSHPEAAVLYMSGYSGNALDQQGVEELGAQCMQKPFLLEDLAARVQEFVRSRRIPVSVA